MFAGLIFGQNIANINVSISNIDLNGSKVFIGLYNNDSSFKLKSGAVDSLIFVPDAETADVSFNNIPFGTYAIAVFQDINSNGILDSKKFNIPEEPFGISNYPINKSKLPPTFKKAKFILSGDFLISIPLIFKDKYPDKFEIKHQ